MNPYQSIPAELVEINKESPTITTYRIVPEEEISFATGQFVELTVPGVGEAPFTPSSSPSVTEEMEISIMHVGEVTNSLAEEVEEGDTLGVRGPFGNGYPLEEYQNREIYIVGGGVGLAPLRSLIYALRNTIDDYEAVRIKFGARTPEDIIYKQEVRQWREEQEINLELTVDSDEEFPEWDENVGVVTTIMDESEVDSEAGVAVVCGPPIMMKFATQKLLDMGYDPAQIYLSMEKNMSCGVGKCGHCGIGPYYVCQDGPVMTYDMLEGYDEVFE